MPHHSPRRFYSNGRAIWFIDTIWAAARGGGLSEFDFPIADIPILDEVCWFSDVWGKKPTCRAVIEHCQRIMAADLAYPVILAPNGDVLDGVHRIAKAMLAGQTSVRAVRLPAMPPPDELIPPTDPRYEPETALED